jgi:hypothetical protein
VVKAHSRLWWGLTKNSRKKHISIEKLCMKLLGFINLLKTFLCVLSSLPWCLDQQKRSPKTVTKSPIALSHMHKEMVKCGAQHLDWNPVIETNKCTLCKYKKKHCSYRKTSLAGRNKSKVTLLIWVAMWRRSLIRDNIVSSISTNWSMHFSSTKQKHSSQ